MQPHDAVTAAIARARDAGRPALVAYLTAGYPSRERFLPTLARVAAHADVVEIGVPFSDPMADGMTIQRASHAALQQGVTVSWILDQLAEREPGDTPLVLMSYLNPLLAYGYDRLADRALEAGVAGFIVPDLPYEECRPLDEALSERGLALVQLVTPATPDERLRRLAAASRGFVYAVTMTGTTGGARELPADVVEYLDRVTAASELPVCAGFGIRNAEQVGRIGRHAAGVIVGSALVEVLERDADPGEFLSGLANAPG